MTSIPIVQAFPSLAALQQALRGASRSAASSSRVARSQHLHTSSYNSLEQQNQASSSSSALDSQAAASITNTNPDLDGLHSQFDFNGESYEIPPFDEGDLIAVPNKPTFVHVKLANLRKAASTVSDLSSPSDSSTSSKPGKGRQYVPLSAHVFDAPARKDVIHSAVVYYLDAQRSGTASTKTRSDVRGSKKKLRPQKGSGQARLGTMSNPILRGGAVAHGPRPRDHSTKLPRRVRELALRSALSSKWRQGDLHVVPTLDWIAPPSSTGPLARLLGGKGWADALFLTAPRNPQPSPRSLVEDSRPSAADPVYDEQQRLAHQSDIRNFVLASGNIPRIELIELDALTEEYRENIAKTSEDKKKPGELHAYEVLRRKKVICDLGAVEWLEEKLGGAIFHQEAGLDASLETEAVAPHHEATEEAVSASSTASPETEGVKSQ
ncbi:ribosomal protein L4 [Testicularia cyperi]|uniref:Large ribosomal subunit protein uL4m n=1 Tax=Testicularia cyperi TaxID=1882483 RepID=A0A317XWA5_9BASI|nr:ribosomal protein L4 [Testicularia cyperi]